MSTLTIILAIIAFALCITGLLSIFAIIYLITLKCNDDNEDDDLIDDYPYDEELYR